MKIQATSLLTFSLLLQEAIASAVTQLQAESAPQSAFLVDVSDKFIGRVRYGLEFDPWVTAQFISPELYSKDDYVCMFEFKMDHPWQDAFGVVAPAQHLSHDCHSQLVKMIYFQTVVPGDYLLRQSTDTTQPIIEYRDDNTALITSMLTAPKTDEGADTGSQDAWCFPINDPFDQATSTWSYTVDFVYAWETNPYGLVTTLQEGCTAALDFSQAYKYCSGDLNVDQKFTFLENGSVTAPGIFGQTFYWEYTTDCKISLYLSQTLSAEFISSTTSMLATETDGTTHVFTPEDVAGVDADKCLNVL